MFNLGLGWSELLVLMAVALIVVGPKDLPYLMRQIGMIGGRIRAAGREFQRGLETMARESGLDDIKNTIADPTLTQPFDAVHESMQSAARAYQQAAAPTPTPEASTTPDEAGPAEFAPDEAGPDEKAVTAQPLETAESSDGNKTEPTEESATSTNLAAQKQS